MLRRFSVNFAILSMIIDGLLVALMLHLAAILRPLLNELPFIHPLGSSVSMPAGMYFVLPACWIMVFASAALYDGKKYVRVVDEFTALSLASVLASVSLAGILYLSYREISRAQYLFFVLFSYFSFLTWRAVARLLFRMRRVNSMTIARRVLIVGTGPIGMMVEERLKDGKEYDLTLVGFVDDDPPDTFHGNLLSPVSALRETVARFHVTDVIVAFPPNFYAQVRKAALLLEEEAVRVWVALGFLDLALYKTAIEDFAGLPLLNLRASALDDYERIVKRSFDLLFGLFAMFLSLPLMIVAVLAILFDDGFPFLFCQKRVGENGHVFEMYKLRTMIRNAEELRQTVEALDENGNLIHKTREDPRVTRVGRFLRRFSIDELPQLFNVVKGDMSLVGPRPELPYLVEQYQPWQRQRLAVPPGITGWWQVTGRSDRVMHLHTEDDLYYVQNYSIWLDLQIIMRTLWAVLLGKGAY